MAYIDISESGTVTLSHLEGYLKGIISEANVFLSIEEVSIYAFVPLERASTGTLCWPFMWWMSDVRVIMRGAIFCVVNVNLFWFGRCQAKTCDPLRYGIVELTSDENGE